MSMTAQSLDEGYVELANAILAFAVFSQTVLDPEHLRCDWGRLFALRRQLAGTYGVAMLDRALEIALNSARDLCPGTEQERLLAGLASPTSTHGIARRLADFDALQAELKRIFKEEWAYLPRNVQTQLIDAEHMWCNFAHLIGTGRGDFGATVNIYGRIVEVILTSIVAPVFESDAYRIHREQQRKLLDQPTLGPALHLLKNYAHLPTALQQELNKYDGQKMKLHMLLQLVPGLLTLVRRRDDGSHTFKVRGKQAAEIRDRLLEKGLLRDFFRATVLVECELGAS